jgi:hypothetical protein
VKELISGAGTIADHHGNLAKTIHKTIVKRIEEIATAHQKNTKVLFSG